MPPARRTRELAALALLLALGGCSFAVWTCEPGGGLFGHGGGCRVMIVRALTDVDLVVLTEGKAVAYGSKPDAEAIAAAAALLAHPVPQPATRHRFDDRPPVPEPKPARRRR